LQPDPPGQDIEQRLRFLWPDGLAPIVCKRFEPARDLIDPTELLQRELEDLSLVRCAQIKENLRRARLRTPSSPADR